MGGGVIFITQEYEVDIYEKHFSVGLFSFLLFLVNWILVVIFGYLMFKIKKLDKDKSTKYRAEKMHEWMKKNEEVTKMGLPLLFNSDVPPRKNRSVLVTKTESRLSRQESQDDNDVVK